MKLNLRQRTNKLIRTAIGAVVIAVGFGAAQAASFTSQTYLTNDLPDTRNCGTNGTSACRFTTTPDGDLTYSRLTATTGWKQFGTSNNPLPNFLLGIDPLFGEKYVVDSLTIKVEHRWGVGTWQLQIADGSGGPTTSFPFQIGNGQGAWIEQFILDGDDAAFQRALTDGFMWRAVRTSGDLWLFNVKAYVNYSELPPAIPEPAEWAMLLAGLVVIGFIAQRRREFRFE
jgi:hypothetical protein